MQFFFFFISGVYIAATRFLFIIHSRAQKMYAVNHFTVIQHFVFVNRMVFPKIRVPDFIIRA